MHVKKIAENKDGGTIWQTLHLFMVYLEGGIQVPGATPDTTGRNVQNGSVVPGGLPSKLGKALNPIFFYHHTVSRFAFLKLYLLLLQMLVLLELPNQVNLNN